MAELMQWMEEKGLMAADQRCWEPGSTLQKLKRHKAVERELRAAHGRMEGLQQVQALDRGCKAYSSLSSQPNSMAYIHGTHSLKEEATSVTTELGSPDSSFTQLGIPLFWHPNQPRKLALSLPPHYPPPQSSARACQAP